MRASTVPREARGSSLALFGRTLAKQGFCEWGSRGSNSAKANYEFAAFTRLLDPPAGLIYHKPRTGARLLEVPQPDGDPRLQPKPLEISPVRQGMTSL